MKRIIIALGVTFSIFCNTSYAQSKVETVEGLKKIDQWKKTNGEPVVDAEGRLLYAFGESMPQVVCAPLTLCDIAMQPGEEITSVRLGDKQRWLVNNARSGEGGRSVEHLIIKPTSAGLNTTLFVGTNRRVYVIQLLSHESEFMSKVGFLYNEQDDESLAQSTNSDIALLPPVPKPQPVIDTVVTVIEPEPTEEIIEEHEVLAHRLNFKYTVTGPNVVWKPVRVYDDGVKTFIDMDKHRVSARELPIFLNNDTDRRGHMINYRYIPHDARFVVDGLFNKGTLVLGEGRKRVKVRIAREHASHRVN